MKRSDYPGQELPRKELQKRLFAAYQLAGRLLLAPDDPEDVRSEMVIVLLDFLSDPSTADAERIELASRGFVSKHIKVVAITNSTVTNGTTFEVKSA